MRELAGNALGALVGCSPDAPEYVINLSMPKLIDSVYKTSDLCERHGSIWVLSDILLALSNLNKVWPTRPPSTYFIELFSSLGRSSIF